MGKHDCGIVPPEVPIDGLDDDDVMINIPDWLGQEPAYLFVPEDKQPIPAEIQVLTKILNIEVRLCNFISGKQLYFVRKQSFDKELSKAYHQYKQGYNPINYSLN
jgi:hypothetical protein